VAGSRRKRVATASNAVVAQVADGFSGSAVEAVVAGVFAAAALEPSVLLGPVQMLLGGAGIGLRAVDGRVRQPGHGLPRPRGFLPESQIPDAARVGVPLMPAALVAALLTAGDGALGRVLAPAVQIAKEASDARAQVLDRVARRGAATLRDVGSELIATAGRNMHGLLTERDLDEARPVVTACEVATAVGRRLATVPWGATAVRDASAEPLPARRGQVVAAVDGRGMVAVAFYEIADGLPIPELGLVAPFCADPVLRGKTRTRPGEPLAAPAPIALVEKDGLVELAVGVTGSGPTERALQAILDGLDTHELLDDALAAGRGGPGSDTYALAVVQSRDGVRAVSGRGGL
jgi:gamma-glutamyltranspeptidase/glutathione hydrolase